MTIELTPLTMTKLRQVDISTFTSSRYRSVGSSDECCLNHIELTRGPYRVFLSHINKDALLPQCFISVPDELVPNDIIEDLSVEYNLVPFEIRGPNGYLKKYNYHLGHVTERIYIDNYVHELSKTSVVDTQINALLPNLGLGTVKTYHVNSLENCQWITEFDRMARVDINSNFSHVRFDGRMYYLCNLPRAKVITMCNKEQDLKVKFLGEYFNRTVVGYDMGTDYSYHLTISHNNVLTYRTVFNTITFKPRDLVDSNDIVKLTSKQTGELVTFIKNYVPVHIESHEDEVALELAELNVDRIDYENRKAYVGDDVYKLDSTWREMKLIMTLVPSKPKPPVVEPEVKKEKSTTPELPRSTRCQNNLTYIHKVIRNRDYSFTDTQDLHTRLTSANVCIEPCHKPIRFFKKNDITIYEDDHIVGDVSIANEVLGLIVNCKVWKAMAKDGTGEVATSLEGIKTILNSAKVTKLFVHINSKYTTLIVSKDQD